MDQQNPRDLEIERTIIYRDGDMIYLTITPPSVRDIIQSDPFLAELTSPEEIPERLKEPEYRERPE